MVVDDKIGIVGGGQMGEALIRGIIKAGVARADSIHVLEPDAGRLDHLQKTYGVASAGDPAALTGQCHVLILAVKPQVMPDVLAQFGGHVRAAHLIISIAAGVTIAAMESGLPEGCRIIRVMPNTPALVLAGASAMSANSEVQEEDMTAAMRIFAAVGTCLQVPESMLDAVTGLSGSGPGYVFAFIEAMIDGGVLAGLPRDTAEKLVLQTVYGAARLAMESGEPAAVLRGRVTSPGGTTICGLRILEESGFRGAVMTAVDAAAERSRELGR